jgi:DedD protein
MNPELKQRLIGAAVVTALATIFIPMLFDDPVDKKGTLVSELPIPVAPIKSPEVSANKLPTPASKILNKPNTTTEPPSDTEDDPAEPVVDAEIVDDAEAEATEPPAANGSKPHPASTVVGVDKEQSVIEAEEEDVPSEPLDTGVVDEVKPPVKKPAKPIEPKVEVMVKPAIKKTEANTPKLLPTTKPINTEPVPTVKPVVKKPEVAIPKSLPAAKPQPTVKPAATNVVAVPSEKVAKPKPPELVRWTIHAGSFGQKDNATALMKTLREQGIPVSIETIQNAKGPMYRLKIGPDLDKKKAAANKAKLDKQGVSNVLIAE